MDDRLKRLGSTCDRCGAWVPLGATHPCTGPAGTVETSAYAPPHAMAPVLSLPGGPVLTEDARTLLAATSVHRRFGRLETALPNAYVVLCNTADDKLREEVDNVFARLIDLLKEPK